MTKKNITKPEVAGEELFAHFFGGDINTVIQIEKEDILDSFPSVYENKTFIKSLYKRMYLAMRDAAITPNAEDRRVFLGKIDAINSILQNLKEAHSAYVDLQNGKK